MNFKEKILKLVENSKECAFVTPFIQANFLEEITKKTDAKNIDIYTLPTTCEVLEKNLKTKSISFLLKRMAFNYIQSFIFLKRKMEILKVFLDPLT